MKLFKLKINTIPFLVITATIFISVSLVMSSCRKPVDTFENFEASNLRVVNGLPGPADVKFYLDSFNLTLTGTLDYGLVSPIYYVVRSGSRTAKLYSTATGDTFAKTSIQLDPRMTYTLFVAGNVATPKYFITPDELSVTTADKVKIRLANLGVTGGDVDVTMQLEDTVSAPQPKPEVIALTDVPAESISNYTLVPVPVSKGNTVQERHTIRIYEAGTTNLLASVAGVNLQGTSTVTIIITGIRDGTPALAISSALEWIDY
jgi:hypothetical protein